jgi:hypothetical protein
LIQRAGDKELPKRKARTKKERKSKQEGNEGCAELYDIGTGEGGTSGYRRGMTG